MTGRYLLRVYLANGYDAAGKLRRPPPRRRTIT